MSLQHYRQLIAWQKAMDFAACVYAVTKHFPREEIYGPTSQLRRACVSVPSNIAEGQGRGTTTQFLQFLGTSKGSLQEAETQLLLAHRFEYIAAEELDPLLVQSDEVGRIISGLRTSLETRIRESSH